jgi:hypothetical protein
VQPNVRAKPRAAAAVARRLERGVRPHRHGAVVELLRSVLHLGPAAMPSYELQAAVLKLAKELESGPCAHEERGGNNYPEDYGVPVEVMNRLADSNDRKE